MLTTDIKICWFLSPAMSCQHSSLLECQLMRPLMMVTSYNPTRQRTPGSCYPLHKRMWLSTEHSVHATASQLMAAWWLPWLVRSFYLSSHHNSALTLHNLCSWEWFVDNLLPECPQKRVQVIPRCRAHYSVSSARTIQYAHCLGDLVHSTVTTWNLLFLVCVSVTDEPCKIW
jgi:hypothetical protein